jgi:transcriptional regulator with XRE-family HTH domain
MHVTQGPASSRSQVMVRLVFAADVFDAAMRDRGHTSDADRAAAAGITKMTLSRWRRGTFTSTPRSAHQAAYAAGVTVDQLFVPKPVVKSVDDRVAELLAAAPPITDEQREAAVRLLAEVPVPRRTRKAA